MIERRAKNFIEKLSWFMAWIAALGGMYVILDPVITFKLSWAEIKVGGEGFSEQLKGAVVALILVEGWKAVKEFWLGASASGQKQQESITRIAEGSSPAQAAAVAAATGVGAQTTPLKAENINVEGTQVNVSEKTP